MSHSADCMPELYTTLCFQGFYKSPFALMLKLPLLFQEHCTFVESVINMLVTDRAA